MKFIQPTTINKTKLQARQQKWKWNMASGEWEESEYIATINEFFMYEFLWAMKWAYGDDDDDEREPILTAFRSFSWWFIRLIRRFIFVVYELFFFIFRRWSVDRNILVVIYAIRLFKIECMGILGLFSVARVWFGVCGCDFAQCYSHSIVSSIFVCV